MISLIENINNKCRPFQMAATLLYGDNWIDKVVTKVQLSQIVWITIFSRGSWRLETNKEKKYHY